MRRILLAVLMLTLTPVIQADQVNVYSARQENLIKPVLDRFTEHTGIRVNLVTGGADELITRLELEGRNSPADVLLTVDVGRLHRARELGLLQPVGSDVLTGAVPERYRDPDGYWFAMSLRSRVIVYNRDTVSPDQLSTYADLAEPHWRGRVCVRSSSNVYNQSLVAAMISRQGVEATEEWAKGLVANFARQPQGGDRDQISAVAVGQCDVAIVNTYYLAGMMHSPVARERRTAESVGLFWPDQQGQGAHINASGAGLTNTAPNATAAVRLLEFLISEEAQSWYAEANNEYPVRDGIKMSATLAQWGDFIADELALEDLGTYNAEAVRLMDRAGWR
jgi:iron(III) transport system substrate-binding protein